MKPIASDQSPIFSNRELIAGFERWMAAKRYALSTQKIYGKIIRDFERQISPTAVATADLVTLRHFLGSCRAKGASPYFASTIRTALSAFYGFLATAGVVRFSPAAFLKTPKLPQKVPRCCSESEIEKLLAAARDPCERAILELAYASGLRAGELVKLQIEDLNLRDRKLIAHGDRRKRDRVAFFGSKAADALRIYIGKRRHGPLLLNRFGRQLSRDSLKKLVRRVATRAGLPHVHIQTLRHSFATHLLNHGASIHYVQALLGDTDLRDTQRYWRSATADLIQVHARCHPRGGPHEETKENSDRQSGDPPAG